MGIRIKLIAFILGVGFFLLVLRQVKRTRISPAYTLLWLAVAAFLVSISVLEGVYRWLATKVIGIIDARHVIYIVIIGFMMILLFYLCSVITKMNDQIQNILSYLAIYENKLENNIDKTTSRIIEDKASKCDLNNSGNG
jgi:hypothetical protein